MAQKATTALLLSLIPLALQAQDPGCPRYPSAMRTELEQSLELDRAFTEYSRKVRAGKSPSSINDVRMAQSANFIDQAIQAKMRADKVTAAPPTTDSEFLRRIYLDLTGRIPDADTVVRFLNNPDPAKRTQLIDELLDTPAYADQMALFLLNRFKVTRAHESVSTLGRDVFYNFVRQMFADDRPYDDFARQFISAAGEVDSVPGTQFFARWMDLNGPIQDSWDDLTEKISTNFLGYKTECVSCHNGRAHLEKINLYLSRKTRKEFWQMSSFLSRMQYVRFSDDPIGFRPRIIVVDRSYGSYTGSVSPTNPGCRPARIDAVVTPALFNSGKTPQNGNWRAELGRLITEDKQFARAAANYMWSNFFGYGIVDPPDAWDMARIDPANPPPGDWPMQNSHPELLEQMADYLIANNFRLKALIRQIVTSETYQLSSRYEGAWRPEYVRYFARYQSRRLSAEQMYDAMITATRTEQPMALIGSPKPVMYANQLPDPTEPFSDSRVVDFLNQFGRGNWMTVDRSSEPTLLGLLFMMNDSNNVNRSMGTASAAVGINNRVHEVNAKYSDDGEAVKRMFLATLSRYPSEDELRLVLSRKAGPRYQWLSDLQWSLVNKLDFAFNY